VPQHGHALADQQVAIIARRRRSRVSSTVGSSDGPSAPLPGTEAYQAQPGQVADPGHRAPGLVMVLRKDLVLLQLH
jgi:hypothetical protein